MPPYAYIAASSDNALTILDIANPALPAFVGSIQGAGAAPWLGGASAVFVVGNYAYVACDMDNALTIIDISNPAAPAFVGSIQGFGAPNWLGQATDVFVVGNYAYVAARRVSAGPTQDSALTIIDISNPALPAFVGSILLTGGSAPNWLNEACGILVRGSLAYVVSDGNGWPFDGANALTIIDVSNPAIPTLSGLIQGLGIPNWLGGARGISLQGNYAYIAAYYNNGGALPALTIIDISNPALPAFVGSIQGGWGAPPWLAGAYGIHVRGNYAYIAANTDSALSIIDISNPAAPVFVGSIQDPGGPLWPLLGAIDVSIQGNYAYIAVPWGGPASDGAFTVVDISNPLVPIIIGSIQGAGAPPWLGGACGVYLSSARIKGNPNVDQLMYQHVERME